MDASKFLDVWDSFNSLCHDDAPLPERVALFAIWFKDGEVQRRNESMGVPNLMESVGELLQSTMKDLDNKNKPEDWRGDEH